MNNDNLKSFDTYEIHPCMVVNIHGDVEQCNDDEVEFWTLYGHVYGEGVYAIADFPDEFIANNVLRLILGHDFIVL
jgi:hypothetical protein